MRRLRLLLTASLLAAPWPAAGELLLVAAGDGLYALSDGATLRVGRAEDPPVVLELPPGSAITQLTETADGWLAAGQLPTPDGTDLLLIENHQGNIDMLPVPAARGARLRGQPVALIDRGQLVGLAWAAGSRQDDLQILASLWEGEKWSAPELVSARGPGSQLAPQAVVLDGGSWLLVWTAFDGTDDEIFWSRRPDDRWTAPQRVHPDNQVPDITPTLATLEAGAVVVWSTFDGSDYRLQSARLVEDGWIAAGRFGERGSLWPELQRQEGRLILVYQTVAPPSWTVAEIDPAGARRREARVDTTVNERPLVVLRGSDGVALTWITGPVTPQTARQQVVEWFDLP